MSHLSDQVLALRVATLYQKVALSTGEAPEEDSSQSSNKGRVPARWREWLETTQQGGKRLVTNPSPNPLSRDRHRQVSFSTALKNKHFYQEAMKAYQAWVEKAEEKEKSKGEPEVKTEGVPNGKPEVTQPDGKPEAKTEERGEAPKKSWKERMKGLGAKALDFVKKAPDDVKKFIEDEGHRRKVLQGIHKTLVEAPEKFVKNAIHTVKEEVHEYKEAGAGVKAVIKGGKMTSSQKKAFKTVAVHMAISIAASAVISSGPLGIASTFAQGTAKTLAMKAVARALEHVAVLQEVAHIGHGIGGLLTHLASTRNPSETLYHYAAETEDDGDVDEVFGNFMAANVAKELETFGSDEDIDSVLTSFDEGEEEPSEREDFEEEEPSDEEPLEEEPPSEDENIVKVNLEDVSEIWFVKKNQGGSEKIANDPIREFENAIIASRVAIRCSRTLHSIR
jgi:hypothetical protein